MKALASNPVLLVFSNVWIEPNSSAAGWRMLHLLQLFRDLGFQINYATTAGETNRAVSPAELNIQFHQIRVNDDEVDELIKTCAPGIVIFDRFMVEEQFGWRVAAVRPEAIRILDMEDMHSLRYARESAIVENVPFQTSDLNKREMTFRELASIHRCDLTLVISNFEYALLREHFGIMDRLLCYFPFYIAKDQVHGVSQLPSFEERSDFITIGNFRHAPNRDAVLVLKKELWPIIHAKLPNARLNVYGAYPDQKMLQLTNAAEGFYVHGPTNNLSDVMITARMLLAPLRFGAGLKGKLVDAMRFGLPSVTTSVGCEGIADVAGWPGAVSDSVDEMALSAIALYQSEALWKQAQIKIESVLKSRFMNPQFVLEMQQKLFEISSELDSHRRKNWIGGMLQMHSQKSYTYLSKWIMAKNGN